MNVLPVRPSEVINRVDIEGHFVKSYMCCAGILLFSCSIMAGCQQAGLPTIAAAMENSPGESAENPVAPIGSSRRSTALPSKPGSTEKAVAPAETPLQNYLLSPGGHVQFELQTRFIEAVPGDVIQLEEGHYQLLRQLDLAADKITIRGRGADKTILSFKGQSLGAAGIEVTGNHFVMEDLAIEDTAGNGVKILGAKNVTLRGVRVEWTGEQTSANGAYGLYPVQCENVLMENCTVIGASDAGVYVGQCRNVIVRSCRAEKNVAGIEIENTIDADVYGNLATNNSGGLLVFDLPGLQQKQGRNVRVYKNRIDRNNHVNFADPGGMVATVSPGTGVMVMATDHVEVFDNDISGNDTVSVLIVSMKSVEQKTSDPAFNPTSNFVSIHDNRISGGGTRPAGMLEKMLGQVIGNQFPDILWDGVRPDGDTPHAMHIAENGEASFVNFNLSDLSLENVASGKYRVEQETTAYRTSLAPLPKVKLDPADDVPLRVNRATQVYRSLPRHLSELNLFQSPLAKHLPQPGVQTYELNTPLFSDYALKRRFFRIPDGEQVKYREGQVLDFPVGTMMSKTFSYPVDMRDISLGEQHIETRIQIRESDGWYGVTYLWNDDQRDAVLTTGGAEAQVSWIHDSGKQKSITYEIPNANQCLSCHAQSNAYQPIGPTARNLNRSPLAASQTGNQLTDMVQQGALSGLPEIRNMVAMSVFDDPQTGDVPSRARAWLHVNCAHCHNPTGSARTTGLDLRDSQDQPGSLGIFKNPVAAGQGAGGHKYDIVPGHPDESILVYRLESTEPAIRMPSVGRCIVQPEAVALIRNWIQNMPSPDPSGLPHQ